MEGFQTEFEFTLPIGYTDESGNLHKEGRIRLATAGDEILPMRDPRVQSNPSYLSVILLSRVITRLGDVKNISTKVIEGLYAGDFSFLQELYARINENGRDTLKVSCPKCTNVFEVEARTSGE